MDQEVISWDWILLSKVDKIIKQVWFTVCWHHSCYHSMNKIWFVVYSSDFRFLIAILNKKRTHRRVLVAPDWQTGPWELRDTSGCFGLDLTVGTVHLVRIWHQPVANRSQMSENNKKRNATVLQNSSLLGEPTVFRLEYGMSTYFLTCFWKKLRLESRERSRFLFEST